MRSPSPEVRDLGERPEILEQLTAARRLEQPGHVALAIVEVAKHQRLGRARLRAGRLDLAVLDLALLGLGGDLGGRDALRAESALLHDADFPNRDVRIELQVKRLLPRRVEEVEEAHVVRAGVGAVARADAAVVDLRVG